MTLMTSLRADLSQIVRYLTLFAWKPGIGTPLFDSSNQLH